MTVVEAKNRIISSDQVIRDGYAEIVANAKSVSEAAVKSCEKKEQTRIIILIALWVSAFIVGLTVFLAIGYSYYYYKKYGQKYRKKDSEVAKQAASNLLQEIDNFQRLFN